jgi:hypothetical protein
MFVHEPDRAGIDFPPLFTTRQRCPSRLSNSTCVMLLLDFPTELILHIATFLPLTGIPFPPMERNGMKNFDQHLRESRNIQALSQTCSRLHAVLMYLRWHSITVGCRMRDHDYDMEKYLHDNRALALFVK